MEAKKPPLGLIPRIIFWEDRIADIDRAVERYKKENVLPPKEWFEEKSELEEKIRNQKRVDAVNIMATGNESGVRKEEVPITYTGEDVMKIIDRATNKTYLGKTAEVISKVRENLYKETNAISEQKRKENEGMYVMKGFIPKLKLDVPSPFCIEKNVRTVIQNLRYKAVILEEEEAKELATDTASELSSILKGK